MEIWQRALGLLFSLAVVDCFHSETPQPLNCSDLLQFASCNSQQILTCFLNAHVNSSSFHVNAFAHKFFKETIASILDNGFWIGIQTRHVSDLHLLLCNCVFVQACRRIRTSFHCYLYLSNMEVTSFCGRWGVLVMLVFLFQNVITLLLFHTFPLVNNFPGKF